jgi:hypothetical protein
MAPGMRVPPAAVLVSSCEFTRHERNTKACRGWKDLRPKRERVKSEHHRGSDRGSELRPEKTADTRR